MRLSEFRTWKVKTTLSAELNQNKPKDLSL